MSRPDLTRGSDGRGGRLGALCAVAITTVPAAGASVSVPMPSGLGAIIHASDETSAWLIELQSTIAEGPTLDAYADRHPVLVSDTAMTSARWAVFANAAAERGVCAVFAVPLLIGSSSVGVLTLHRASADALDKEGLALALQLSDQIAWAMLDRTQELEAAAQGGDGDIPLDVREDYLQSATHQASGMIMAQLGVPITEAMARLRGHAFATGRTVQSVAADVVARRLHLGDDNGAAPEKDEDG